jgi:bacteriocin biosynthesis cyclodehydratase domain-containing protein
MPTRLHPSARVLWRSPTQAQFELGSRRLIVDGVDTEVMQTLLGRSTPTSGSRSTPRPRVISDLQHRLIDAGMLWPEHPDVEWDEDCRRMPPRPRLAIELAALSTYAGESAADLLGARQMCRVTVLGTGRAGPHIAAVLSAAGVGRVHLVETTPAQLRHAVPGGVSPADEGTPLAAAAQQAITRVAPEADCLPAPFGEPTDLIVLADDEPTDADRRDALHARGRTHLLVRLGGDHGVVGPLVIPGLTSCLRCADLHRLDRDPAWNALAAQLSVPHRTSGTSEVALATVIAGIAAQQALDFLDGGHPDTVDGTLEMHRPDYRVRRRSWPAHPECDCMCP